MDLIQVNILRKDHIQVKGLIHLKVHILLKEHILPNKVHIHHMVLIHLNKGLIHHMVLIHLNKDLIHHNKDLILHIIPVLKVVVPNNLQLITQIKDMAQDKVHIPHRVIMDHIICNQPMPKPNNPLLMDHLMPHIIKTMQIGAHQNLLMSIL